MCDISARLDGKVAIVTGGSSGVGLETAKLLAKKGARVIIASRNMDKLKAATEEIQTASGNTDIAYRTVDLASFTSVRNFVNETRQIESRLDILVNNAGAVALPDNLTEDGVNLTMQVNYFGAFLLTYLLLPMLKKSAPSRVITGTAATMYVGEIDFDHWTEMGRYNAITGLSNSKLADDLFSMELSRRMKNAGVSANSYDPFVVRDTEILSNLPNIIGHVSKFFINLIGQSKERVGQQVAYLASATELEGVGGMHYKFCKQWYNHWLAGDEDFTRRLWDESKKVVKLTPEEDWELATEV